MDSIIFIGLLLLPLMVQANAIYQYETEDGQVVFTDQPPKQVDFKKVTIANANQIQIDPALKARTQSYYADLNTQKKQKRLQKEQSMKEKHLLGDKMTEAKRALEAAKVIKAGDFYPNKSGGIRYKQDYLKRINQAERNLDRLNQPQ